MLELGILKTFNSQTHTAGVQLAGSLTTYLDDISVSVSIPSSAMVVGNYVLVAIPGGNPRDACVVASWPQGSSGGGGAAGEGHITIIAYSYSSIGQGTWGLTFNDGRIWRGAFKNLTQANGDNASYKVYLDAGTYTLLVVGQAWGSGAITDLYLDAVEVASFDWYAASAAHNTRKIQSGIVVASSGIYDLKVQIDGKSGASYQVNLSYLVLRRTA